MAGETADDLARPRLVGSRRRGEHEPVGSASAGGHSVLGEESRAPDLAVLPGNPQLPFPLEKEVRKSIARERLDPAGEQRQVERSRVFLISHRGALYWRAVLASLAMSLAERRTEFLSVRIARGIARRGLFQEKTPGALAEAVRTVFAEEIRKERAIDEEARRIVDASRSEISSQGLDSNELFRKVRRKLAEQKGIVL
jgi:ribosomal protein L29